MQLFKFHPHPYRMRLKFEGLSHGLKTCPRHVFLTAFRVPSLAMIPKKNTTHKGWCSFWCERWDSICIFAVGENYGSPPSSRWRQQSTGLLHLDRFEPLSIQHKKEKPSLLGWLFFFGARDGTRTHTAEPHAPQTCLSTMPTLSQALTYYNRQHVFCQ